VFVGVSSFVLGGSIAGLMKMTRKAISVFWQMAFEPKNK